MEGLSYEPKLMLLVLALFFHNGFFLCNENSRHTKKPGQQRLPVFQRSRTAKITSILKKPDSKDYQYSKEAAFITGGRI